MKSEIKHTSNLRGPATTHHANEGSEFGVAVVHHLDMWLGAAHLPAKVSRLRNAYLSVILNTCLVDCLTPVRTPVIRTHAQAVY